MYLAHVHAFWIINLSTGLLRKMSMYINIHMYVIYFYSYKKKWGLELNGGGGCRGSYFNLEKYMFAK